MLITEYVLWHVVSYTTSPPSLEMKIIVHNVAEEGGVMQWVGSVNSRTVWKAHLPEGCLFLQCDTDQNHSPSVCVSNE